MSSRPPAVVLGLDCITGLQTARHLARADIPVIGIAKDPRHFACRTRACWRLIPADLDTDELIDVLVALGPSLDARAVLFPCTDATVLLVSRHRDVLAPWYHVVLPDADVVEMLMDKVSFTEHALRVGLPVPATYVLRDRVDALAAADEMPYPAVVKPPVKSQRWREHTAEKAIRVADAAELLEVYDRTANWTDVLLAQQWVPGGDDSLYSCNCYFDADSKPQVTFVARKLRQWPPRTGTSCLGEECRNDEVLETTIDLFADVKFRGLGYVEMKRDPRTGKQYVIEPNIGRPTGRSAIAEAAGVPLLLTQYHDALGLPLPDGREQQYVGTKWVDVRRDLLSSLHYWRQGELTVREWRESMRGPKAHAVLARDDIAPFAHELAQFAGKAVHRGRRSVAARARGAAPPRTVDVSGAPAPR